MASVHATREARAILAFSPRFWELPLEERVTFLATRFDAFLADHGEAPEVAPPIEHRTEPPAAPLVTPFVDDSEEG